MTSIHKEKCRTMNSCSILDPHSSIRFNGVCDRVAASIVRHWAPLVLTMFLPFLQAKKAEELAIDSIDVDKVECQAMIH